MNKQLQKLYKLLLARALRSTHKRISLEERTLSVYSSRKMHHDSDPYEQGQESEEDLYTVR